MKLEPKEISFDQWARAKFKEVESRINPCDEGGRLDPVRLNSVLTTFAGHFAWAITLQEVESNKLNILQHQYERWYKERYNDAYRLIRTENGGGRPPGQVTIESRIVDMAADELERRQVELDTQKSKVDLLKGLIKVLDRQASILQTLSSNMRSELFFAGGIGAVGGFNKEQRNTVAKTILDRAIRTQNPDNS
ncbi:MAG: hypothetical protein CMB80_01345 [Flammeovirgaceae bacterium]|nr:hypothetical protein [Flammeovirgaceae bacterium]|tara:strand:+ start:247 stop:825 length:579 start_codon:yes stop_codon:yes gene_type:complete